MRVGEKINGAIVVESRFLLYWTICKIVQGICAK
jgi:hypothetical protein